MTGPMSEGTGVRDRVRAELDLIKVHVQGVDGSLVATNDGFLVSHDIRDLEPAQIAALAATARALASSGTKATGRGQFSAALFHGSQGYLAVYAAGDSAIVAVIGTADLNVGMLNFCVREIAVRIARYALAFDGWAGAGPVLPAEPAAVRASEGHGLDPDNAQPLPARRRQR